ncbi:hypothetical protein [Pseudoxanthomonas sp. UTMC 1351]|uniref:hypothetical protein n=1 Tax=Pseudoxanthomonas sp. UTMC 1351 TaxID=2695853 RepID=UPI0034CD176C
MPLASISFAVLAGYGTTNVRYPAPGENLFVPFEEARSEMGAMANETLRQLYADQPAAKKAVDNDAGYAVFNNFSMKILIAGGATGYGLAMNNAKPQEIFMHMTEVQAGLGFGVKKFRLVWVLEMQSELDEFVNKGYQLGGQATLAALISGKGVSDAGAMSVSPGEWVYQMTYDGPAAELTIKDTRDYRDNNLN